MDGKSQIGLFISLIKYYLFPFKTKLLSFPTKVIRSQNYIYLPLN